MGFDFSNAKAISAAVVTLVAAVVGLLVTLGIDVSGTTQHAITTFIEIATPAVLFLIGLLHHGSAKVKSAAINAAAFSGKTQAEIAKIVRAK